MPDTKVINLFAGPGSGKSTTAAGVFSLLKIHGVNAEYVSEYAKDRAWEGTLDINHNPFYITAKQHQRQFRLKDKVDVMITDSPLLLGRAYTKWKQHSDMCRYLYSTFNNENYFVERVKDYNPIGRLQSEEEAKEKDRKILKILNEEDVKYTTVQGNIHGINTITRNILKELDVPQLYEIR